MFTYAPMKNKAGIILTGDHMSLSSLHETIHQVVNKTEDRPHFEESDEFAQGEYRRQNEWLLGLAYDTRKAKDGGRQVYQPGPFDTHVGTRYGVKIIWPVLLLQSRILRSLLSGIPSTHAQHADAYALEAVIIAAIEKEFPTTWREILETWTSIETGGPSCMKHNNSICAIFCKWNEEERENRLHTLLQYYRSMGPAFHSVRMQNGKDSIGPEELEANDTEDWQNPEE